jgi:hypothetical protein
MSLKKTGEIKVFKKKSGLDKKAADESEEYTVDDLVKDSDKLEKEEQKEE